VNRRRAIRVTLRGLRQAPARFLLALNPSAEAIASAPYWSGIRVRAGGPHEAPSVAAAARTYDALRATRTPATRSPDQDLAEEVEAMPSTIRCADMVGTQPLHPPLLVSEIRNSH
jgi:hypothetical protein